VLDDEADLEGGMRAVEEPLDLCIGHPGCGVLGSSSSRYRDTHTGGVAAEELTGGWFEGTTRMGASSSQNQVMFVKVLDDRMECGKLGEVEVSETCRLKWQRLSDDCLEICTFN
jgi:hypothetical protein